MSARNNVAINGAVASGDVKTGRPTETLIVRPLPDSIMGKAAVLDTEAAALSRVAQFVSNWYAQHPKLTPRAMAIAYREIDAMHRAIASVLCPLALPAQSVIAMPKPPVLSFEQGAVLIEAKRQVWLTGKADQQIAAESTPRPMADKPLDMAAFRRAHKPNPVIPWTFKGKRAA